MKPDPEYLKRLLTAFEESPDPTTDIDELEQRGLSYQTPEFYFHLRLLNDEGFVEREDGQPGLGVDQMLAGHKSWYPTPLRLTAKGHEFAEALNNNEAFEAVRKSAITSSIGIMRDVAVAALKAAISHYSGVNF